jgi:hypothetical protein
MPDPISVSDPKDSGIFEQEYRLKNLDAEVKALHRLAREKSPPGYDDQRLTIEIQSTRHIDLRVTHPLAVIAPSDCLDEKSVLDHLSGWHPRTTN